MPEIKEFPKMRVACLTTTGPFNESIPRGFDKLFEWLSENNVNTLGTSLAIYLDDPAAVLPEKLRTQVCVSVAPQVRGSGEVETKEIGGMQVAALVYQGTQNMDPAYGELYGWLHAQGYHDAGAPMEVYLSKLGEELRAEINVPIVKMESPHKPKSPEKKSAKKPARKSSTKRAAKKR